MERDSYVNDFRNSESQNTVILKYSFQIQIMFRTMRYLIIFLYVLSGDITSMGLLHIDYSCLYFYLIKTDFCNLHLISQANQFLIEIIELNQK